MNKKNNINIVKERPPSHIKTEEQAKKKTRPLFTQHPQSHVDATHTEDGRTHLGPARQGATGPGASPCLLRVAAPGPRQAVQTVRLCESASRRTDPPTVAAVLVSRTPPRSVQRRQKCHRVGPPLGLAADARETQMRSRLR
uniref:Uncharacterized protein n=1 Tax=Human betaherpesvirus 6 TaxID=10368 RepID=A0A5P9U4Q5_9BETA|nr:hypothetical protein [Human betaherpesvirus 6]QFW66636.1 hypothetical protein [Human betaherpesvirus 6]